MGRALTQKYTDMGDAVVMADLDGALGKEREAEFRAAGKEVMFVQADISREEACSALVEQVMDRYGRIDVLCNNAGRISFYNDFTQMPLSDLNAVLDVNVTAAFILTKLAAAKMIALGIKGVIINTGSISGFLPGDESMAYSISKAAIHSLTVCTARELAAHGIRVVAVAPGNVRGVMKNGTMDPINFPEIKELHMGNRVLEHEEIAEVSYFLSTPAASGINGTIVRVDDGYTSFKMPTSLAKK